MRTSTVSRRTRKSNDAGVVPQGTDAATYRKMFSEGKVAFLVDNGGIPTVIQGTNPDAPIEAVSVPFPSGEAGQVMAVLGVNANSKNVEGTKQFLEWMLADEQQATIQGFLGGSTSATAVERLPAELEARPYVEVFDEAGETAHTFVPTGLEVVTPQVRTIVVAAVLAALQNGSDIKAALDDAQKQVEALL
jgi:multiple sugar transport system substrate-binding protein